MAKNKTVLVLASTFPASDSDPVPAFVKDQIIALKKERPDTKFVVLAPHDARSRTRSFTQHESYDEYRFHYFWPHRLEKLAGRGIMPQLKKNPAYYLMIPFLFFGEWITTKRLVRQLQPDAVYAHWFTPQGVIAGMVAPRANIPFFITTHASDTAVWHKVPLGGKIVRHYSAKASGITAVSRRTMQKLKDFFTDQKWASIANKTAIIPMGVALATASPSKAAHPKQILFIGRLAEKKGVQYLLPAFAQVAKKHTDARLVIGGDGPLLQQLQAQAKELNVDKKTPFVGYVSGQQKQQLLDESSLYIVPSIITASGDAEGLPVSLMEGLAAGKLCIATNESGADDIITDGKDGYLVTQKDVDGLAKAVVTAIGLNDTEKTAMHRAAQKTAQQFSWQEIAKKHNEFLFKERLDG